MTQSISNITSSWIDGTKVYTGIGFNAVTISGNSYDPSSRLLKMQVNGNTVFSIDPSGSMFAANLIVANATVDVSGPFNRANQSYLIANAAYDKANSANVLAFNTGAGANGYATTYAAAVGSAGNAYASRVGTSANAYAAALIGGGGYILPAANTTALGGVKVDGSSITINATGVITSTGGGSSIYVNVKSYGAAGDGSTDDTTAIQNAINATPYGGVVYFPAGTYKTSSTITVSSRRVLMGDGFRNSIIKTNSSSATILSVQSGSDNTYIKSLGLSRSVNHDNVSGTGAGPIGLSITNCAWTFVEDVSSDDSATCFYLNLAQNCEFYQCRAVHERFDIGGGNMWRGWYLDSSSGNPNASCIFVKCGSLYLNGSAGTSHGWYIRGSNTKDVMMRFCESATCSYGAWIESTGGGDHMDIQLVDNIHDGWYREGIRIDYLGDAGMVSIVNGWLSPGSSSAEKCIYARNCRGLTINNVQIAGGAAYPQIHGIYLYQCYTSNITSNLFRQNRYGVTLDQCGMINVEGNTFYNTYSGQDAYIHINLQNSYRCNLIGNSMDARASYGVYFNNGSNFNNLIGYQSINVDGTPVKNDGPSSNKIDSSPMNMNSQTFSAGSECAIIPPWVTRISINLYSVSGSGNMYAQIGQGSGWATSGYNGVSSYIYPSGTGATGMDGGIGIAYGFYAQASSGTVVFERYGTNAWVASSVTSCAYFTATSNAAGRVDLGNWSRTDNYHVRIVNASSGSYSVTWS